MYGRRLSITRPFGNNMAPVYVGDVVYGSKTTKDFVFYEQTLKMVWNPELPKGFITECLSIVYILKIDDEIVKVGQTSGKGGIKACMNFYCIAGTDDPGQNRFAINALMREELNKSKKISVHMIYIPPIYTDIPTLTGTMRMYVPVSAKESEKASLYELKSIHGNYPIWNYQERCESIPSWIYDNFVKYKSMRANSRSVSRDSL